MISAEEWNEIQKTLNFFKREHKDEIEKTEMLFSYLKRKKERKNKKTKKDGFNYA